jgi:Coiled-coil domain-containing protein 55 (DUF2040)
MEKITLKINEKPKKLGIIKPKKMFCVDQDSEDDETKGIKKINKDIIKSSLYKQQFTPEICSALAEDPTIFSYDLYKSKEIPEEQELPVVRAPKYHDHIKKVAEFRKKEKEIIKERVEAKLIEKQIEEIGQSEVYYTQSYLAFIKDHKKFEEKLNDADFVSDLHSIQYNNPEKFLNNIISEPEPYKKFKTEDLINETTPSAKTPENQPKAELIPTKRSESELKCAKERYLSRKQSKVT